MAESRSCASAPGAPSSRLPATDQPVSNPEGTESKGERAEDGREENPPGRLQIYGVWCEVLFGKISVHVNTAKQTGGQDQRRKQE